MREDAVRAKLAELRAMHTGFINGTDGYPGYEVAIQLSSEIPRLTNAIEALLAERALWIANAPLRDFASAVKATEAALEKLSEGAPSA